MGFRTTTDLDFLAANIHGRRSRLAEAERLDELCRLRSLPELAHALLPGKRFLTAIELQRILVLDQVEELSVIASKIGGSPGAFLDWLGVRFQVENLKVLARGLTSGLSVRELGPHLVPLPAELELNVEALASAGTIEGFAALLAPAPLREGVELAMPMFRRLPRPFFIEAGLDRGYLAELLVRAAALPRAHRDDVLAIAQQEADTFHVTLVARGRFAYGLKPEVLTPLHVPGAKLSRQAFRKMAEADSLAEVASAAAGIAIDWPPPGGPTDRPDASLFEALAWNRYCRLANRTFRRSHMGLGAIAAYAAIRRVELANLIRLIEGIRAGLDPKAIRSRLIPRTDLAGRGTAGGPASGPAGREASRV